MQHPKRLKTFDGCGEGIQSSQVWGFNIGATLQSPEF